MDPHGFFLHRILRDVFQPILGPTQAVRALLDAGARQLNTMEGGIHAQFFWDEP
jgi:hypothetical protein